MLRDNQQFNESIKSNSAFLDELRQKMPEFFTATKYDEEGNVIESSAFVIIPCFQVPIYGWSSL